MWPRLQCQALRQCAPSIAGAFLHFRQALGISQEIVILASVAFSTFSLAANLWGGGLGVLGATTTSVLLASAAPAPHVCTQRPPPMLFCCPSAGVETEKKRVELQLEVRQRQHVLRLMVCSRGGSRCTGVHSCPAVYLPRCALQHS